MVDDITLFINNITEAISYVHTMSKNAYVAGDLNIDILKIGSQTYTSFTEYIYIYYLFLIYDLPCFVKYIETSCILFYLCVHTVYEV